MHLEVKAVLVQSMERIHHGNLINFGILPLTFAQESHYELVNGDELEVPGIREGLLCSELTAVNKTRGKEFAVRCSFTPRQVEILKAGGLLNHTRQRTG